jgi:hypothetical protein
MRIALVTAGLLLVASTVQAQEKASGAAAANGIQSIYSMAKGYILKSAEQVPEDKYSFRATKDVRTFGQIIAHIVDAQNNLCAAAAGNPKPYSDQTEKTVTSKAALVAAL